MRSSIKRALIFAGTVVIALTIPGCSAVHGQTRESAERRLTAIVTAVNLETRTLIVEDQLTGGSVRVFVPSGRQVALSRRVSFCGGCSSVEIEGVLRGMIIDMMVTPQSPSQEASQTKR